MFLSLAVLVCSIPVSGVNHAPVITVFSGVEPVIREYGQKVEMPFQVTDADGDSVKMFYKFGNVGEWKELPASSTPNIFPGSIFADLDPKVSHELNVMAFDGHEESRPSPLFWGAIAKVGAKLLPGLLQGLFSVKSASQLAGSALQAEMSSFNAGPMSVSYSVDGSSSWSTPVSYPLGQYQVFQFGDQSEPYLQPGSHSIRFRFQDAGGHVSEQALNYKINSAPTLQLTNNQPLSFKSASTNAVSVPISVSDHDGDPVTVFYRFQNEESWAPLPTSNGGYVLSADAVSNHLSGGNGAVELFAWDGVEKSGDAVKIPFFVVENAVQPEANEEAIAEESDSLGGLSSAGLAGIIIGGVAVIAIVVGVVVYATRKKQESTSTGLVENE